MRQLPTEIIATLKSKHPTITDEVINYYSDLADRFVATVAKEMPEEVKLGYSAGGAVMMNMIIADIVDAQFEMGLQRWLRPKSND